MMLVSVTSVFVCLCACVFCIAVSTGFVTSCLSSKEGGTSLVAQWLRIRLPMQGTWVRALIWEDPTCRGATKPVHHNY